MVLNAEMTILVTTGFCDDWQSCYSWNLEKLSDLLGDKKVTCRVSKKTCGRTMETECVHLDITMQCYCDWLEDRARQPNPLVEFPRSTYVCYIAYKYMKDLFQECPQVFSHVRWSSFGLPEFDGFHSTLWIGSEGANTPCHQDTYGFNLVTQISGRKLWVLFPPEDSKVLYPTRIPYEESSIFSAANIRNPDLKVHPLLKASQPVVVTLCPGQTLYVPQHWWHYVLSLDSSISVNVWVPAQEDMESRYREAIVRTLASSLIRDMSSVGADRQSADGPKAWLNPTETLTDSAINVELLKTSLSHLLENKAGATSSKPGTSAAHDVCDCSPSSASRPPPAETGPRDVDYLQQFVSALRHYPLHAASSPFQAGPSTLKRRAPGSSHADSPKRQKVSTDGRIVVPDGQSPAADVGDVRSKGNSLSCRQVFTISSCPVDVYIKLMRELCRDTLCPCTAGDDLESSDFSLSAAVTPRETKTADCIQPLGQDTHPYTIDRTSQSTSCGVRCSPVGSREDIRGVCQGCHTNQLGSPTSPSLSLAGERESKESPPACVACRRDGPRDTIHSGWSSQILSTDDDRPCHDWSSDTAGPGVGRHQLTAAGDDRRLEACCQDLTQEEVTEALLASVLHPDVIRAVSRQFREQCAQLVQTRERDKCL